MPSAPSDAAVARFRTDFEHLIDIGVGRAGVAVSGGPDSLALLLLCHAAFPGKVSAATVDHGLRPEGAGEAAFVARTCSQLGVPHSILTLERAARGNVSDWARRERYAALDRWVHEAGLSAVLTGHHADDQLETIIMRLNRGSGVGGLAGIRGRNGRILRPLLRWRRSELEEIVRGCGLEPVDDPSNRDDRFDRARLRKELAKADWLDPVAATRSAAALSQAETALEWTANAYFGRRVAELNGVVSFDPRDLPAELLRRLTLRCLTTVNADAAPRGDEIDRLMIGLSEGRIATLADVLCTGGSFWLFSCSPPRRKN
jgi:tRNA(Ile)-lysidine synthase